MAISVAPHDDIMDIFKRNKVVTMKNLAICLRRSAPTIRRRLQEWKAHTSYNMNGRYYTLPGIPEFDQYGLWKHRKVFFSKYGTLKKTVGVLIDQSTAGLSAFDLNELLGLPTHALLSKLNSGTALCREKHQGLFIYFSSQTEIYERQKDARKAVDSSIAPPKPLPDMDAIAVLVEFIKHSNDNAEQLTHRVRRRGVKVSINQIRDLFAEHGLKKNPDWRLSNA